MTLGRPSTRIAFAATLVAAYLGSGALATLHLLLVDHVPCPHAGEWVHADGDHAADHGEGDSWAREPATAAGHDDLHCTLAAHVRAQAPADPFGADAGPMTPCALGATPSDPGDAATADAALAHAPKHSPPA